MSAAELASVLSYDITTMPAPQMGEYHNWAHWH